MAYKKDGIENFGRPPTSPYFSGEQPEITAAPVQGARRKTEVPIKIDSDETWSEPDIQMPQRSMNNVVLQRQKGGNTVVINDEGSDGQGYILVSHKTGSAVQINRDGTVLVKSFGDNYHTSEGMSYHRATGDRNSYVGGEWNVMVEGGSGNIYINGDLKMQCENFELMSRGKMTFSAGEGIEMKGAKFSLEAHSDNFDLIAKNIKIAAAETFSVKSSDDMSFGTEANLNLKGEAEVRVNAEGELKMKGSETKIRGDTVYLDDFVRMAEGVAGETGATDPVNAEVVEVEDPPERRPRVEQTEHVKTRFIPTSLSGRELDEGTEDI